MDDDHKVECMQVKLHRWTMVKLLKEVEFLGGLMVMESSVAPESFKLHCRVPNREQCICNFPTSNATAILRATNNA